MAFTNVFDSETQGRGLPGYWRDLILTQDLQVGLVGGWPSVGLRESILQTHSWERSAAETLSGLEAKFPPFCIIGNVVRKGHLSC